MITIVQRVLDEVRQHAKETAPRECCGILIGGEWRVLESVRAENLADGTTRFELDPRDHIRAMRSARERGLDVVGYYHSHPRSPAFPSETDRAESGYADAVHLIAGIRDGVEETRLFHIGEDAVEELSFAIAPVAQSDAV